MNKLIYSNYLNSTILGILYITSTNSFFINILGYDFNPSKLLLLTISPILIIYITNITHYKKEDISTSVGSNNIE